MHFVEFKMMFPATTPPFCIADMGKFQNQDQVQQNMLSCHPSFIERQDEPREALRIIFHLFALSMIRTTLFGGESDITDQQLISMAF
jgi:hypothetical protein